MSYMLRFTQRLGRHQGCNICSRVVRRLSFHTCRKRQAQGHGTVHSLLKYVLMNYSTSVSVSFGTCCQETEVPVAFLLECVPRVTPTPTAFLVKLLAWWIDEEGYPSERSGKLRWFVRDDNKMIWYDSKEEGYLANKERVDKGELFLKSFTFIRATLDDNPTLLEIDPSYKANLSSIV